MQAGIISDTHGLLRPEALERLRGVDHIVHAGDIGRPGIVEALEALAPVTAIRGNIDIDDWAMRFPETCELELGGHRLLVVHDRNSLSGEPAAQGVDVVISGHSHAPSVGTEGGILFLNPGSAGPRRFRLPVTLALLELDAAAPRAQIIELIQPGHTGKPA